MKTAPAGSAWDEFAPRDPETGELAEYFPAPPGGFAWCRGRAEDSAGEPELWLVPANSADLLHPRLVTSRKALLTHFTMLAAFPPTPARIKRFADRYGYLDHPGIVMVRPQSESVASVPYGEPLKHWRDELEAFRVLHRTWDAARKLERSDADEPTQQDARKVLQENLRWGEKWFQYWCQMGEQAAADQPIGAPVTAADRSFRGGPFEGAWSPVQARWRRTVQAMARRGLWPGDMARLLQVRTEDLLSAAGHYIYSEINARLHGHVSLKVEPGRDRGLFRHVPDSLITAIYLRFAQDLTASTPPRQPCEYFKCRKLIPADRRRDAHFCSTRCREMAGYYRRLHGGSAEAGVAQDRPLGHRSGDANPDAS